jgi:ribosomal protein S18 acetylase RimI-like enzyme
MKRLMIVAMPGMIVKRLNYGKLGQRLAQDDISTSSYPHVFLEATSSSMTTVVNPQGAVVAFLELGTMPSPIPIEKEWNGVKIFTRPELPYLSNLVVDGSIRRRKVGYTMLQLALKIAKKWYGPSQGKENNSNGSPPPFLFLSVDRENVGALAFYESLKFEPLKLSLVEESASNAKIYLKKSLSQ